MSRSLRAPRPAPRDERPKVRAGQKWVSTSGMVVTVRRVVLERVHHSFGATALDLWHRYYRPHKEKKGEPVRPVLVECPYVDCEGYGMALEEGVSCCAACGFPIGRVKDLERVPVLPASEVAEHAAEIEETYLKLTIVAETAKAGFDMLDLIEGLKLMADTSETLG